ncbi:hypothetical protein [Arthrobacter pigmenti]
MEELLERCLTALQGTDNFDWQEWWLGLVPTFIGAVIGAGAAMAVMWWTLRGQRKENARSRMHDVAATIFGDIFNLAGVLHRSEDYPSHIQVETDLAIHLERLHLDLRSDDELKIYEAVNGAMQFIHNTLKTSPKGSTPSNSVDLERAFGLLGQVGNLFSEWLRASDADRSYYAMQLLKLVALADTLGMDAWRDVIQIDVTKVADWRPSVYKHLGKQT